MKQDFIIATVFGMAVFAEPLIDLILGAYGL